MVAIGIIGGQANLEVSSGVSELKRVHAIAGIEPTFSLSTTVNGAAADGNDAHCVSACIEGSRHAIAGKCYGDKVVGTSGQVVQSLFDGGATLIPELGIDITAIKGRLCGSRPAVCVTYRHRIRNP